MRHVFPVLALSLALGAPVFAQKMGGTNDNAPTLTQTFVAQNGVDVLVEYTAITWSSGDTMTQIMDKEGGTSYREYVNRIAASQPLASLRTETALMIGDKTLPKGLYSLYFTIDDDLKWHLNAQNEKDENSKFEWKLELETVKKKRSRLRTLLTPAESPDHAELEIAFGNMEGTLALQKGTPPKTESRKSK